MTASKTTAALFNPKSYIHVTAVGYFFILTFGVLYSCIFVAYPVIYHEDKDRQIKNIVFLLYVFLNIMGNYFLGLKFKSSFSTGLVLMDPPRSWKFCVTCNQHAPPRSHHCSVCNACILKHDHHCFFLCQCVGLCNQKFFIVFALYVAIGSFHAMKILLAFLSLTYVPVQLSVYSISSYFLPVLAYNWLSSSVSLSLTTFFCVILLYGCFATGFGCSFLFVTQCVLIYRGQTLNEFLRNKPSNRSLQNFSQVLGKLWFLQLCLPLPLRSQEEKSPWGYPVYYKSV